jgi:peptidoglycan-associated lipoprotein
MTNVICRSSAVRIAAFTLMGLTLSACAHVKPEELQSSLADLRAEMRSEMESGDQELAGGLDAMGRRVDGLEGRIQDVERELTRLAGEFDATVERLESALRFDMPVYFGFDDAELTETHRELLDRFAGVIREFYPDCLITAEGFTDPAGSVEYNKALGLRRAEAVTAFLASEGGLAASQLRAVSYGESEDRRIASGAHGPGSQGWENRRVALVVDHGGA